MAKKKTTQVSVSQEDNVQAQHVLEQYHQIANNLHTSTDQKQVEAALTEINNMSEGAQMALLKALSKENHVDAADLLTAINELSPLKSVRKEARRSLIRLEGARVYPGWEPPIDRTPAISAMQLTTNPPRFWKGMVTDSLNVGEVQLLLCWEQGDDYKDVRVLGFLLEFFHDGVKDFFTRIESKRSFENFTAQMSARLHDVKIKDCSLAEGRRLLLDALAVNQERGTLPYKDYRLNLSLIDQLILQAPDLDEDTDLDEESEESIDLHGLSPLDVVVNFVESWVDGDYSIAYDLLSSDSPLREGLSKDEWIERRESWADEANPSDLEPNFIYEREPQKSGLWLPNLFGANRSSNRKEIEAGWSIELDEISHTDTLPELPKASAIYEETGRHWFWSSYTLVPENDDWRIQSMTDGATNAQGLSIEELQKRVEELDKYLEKFAKTHKPEEVMQLADAEAEQFLKEVSWRVMKAVYYDDALIKKLPLDRSWYEEAAGRTLTFGQYERCLVYLIALTQRFAEQRGLHLRRVAELQRRLSEKYFDEGDDERAERCQELAEEALRESLAVENSLEAHISLAELLIDENERLDEAEDHLLQAKALITGPSDEAHIELHLGEIATEREQYKEALSHYQRVAELQPTSAEAWFDVGEAHQMLKNYEEAETSYKRAIELEPDDIDYYYTLSKLYTENNQPSKAIEVLEEGLIANPDSAVLHVYMASLYMESGDYRQAEIFLDKAERIDPESVLVRSFRQVLNFSKPKQIPSRPKLRPDAIKLIGPGTKSDSKKKKRR